MMTLERVPPFSIWNTASESPPSVWPVQDTPRSYITMPPSKESPAAMVWTALRAEVPEETGREPSDEPEFELAVTAAVVVVAVAEDLDILMEVAVVLLLLSESSNSSVAWLAAVVVVFDEDFLLVVVAFDDFLVVVEAAAALLREGKPPVGSAELSGPGAIPESRSPFVGAALMPKASAKAVKWIVENFMLSLRRGLEKVW